MIERTRISKEIRKDFFFEKEEIVALICEKHRINKEDLYDVSMDCDSINITTIKREYNKEPQND